MHGLQEIYYLWILEQWCPLQFHGCMVWKYAYISFAHLEAKICPVLFGKLFQVQSKH